VKGVADMLRVLGIIVALFGFGLYMGFGDVWGFFGGTLYGLGLMTVLHDLTD
jgi:hypothetical protein